MTTTTTDRNKTSQRFTNEERAALRERAKELKAAAVKADGTAAVQAAIAAMPDRDRVVGERLHAIITATAPALTAKTWYGMPAYTSDGKIVCWFRNGAKFNERYLTLGFNDIANLDDGNLWPISFAITKLTRADEARIAALIDQALS